ncbi:MAG: short-chain dehydrogenase [Nitrososphaeraceae archaeon]|nr:short-chain dehydrogenase [Nitrososphaeraceae archaeon]
MTNDKKVAIVTGSSSGIGNAIVLELARNNFITYGTMRNLDKISDLKTIADQENLKIYFKQLDVTDDNSVKNAINSIVEETGRIDVLVNNAGYGLVGAFEDLSLDEVQKQFETNVFGVIRVTQAVLPTMRKQESGIIVNISSGAGRFGYPTASAYVSSKFALEGLTESMSYEIEPFGIRTVLIEPGVIKTNFFNSMSLARKSKDPDSPYLQMMQVMEKSVTKMLEKGTIPQYVAKTVLEAVTSKNPKLRYLVGKDVEQWIENKKKMSDEEFHDMMALLG